MNTAVYETFICSGQEEGMVEGQPVIFRHPEISVEPHATMFLFDRYVRAGNRPSPNTWRSAADAVTSWLTFCSEAGISVDSADEEDLKTYRDEYLRTISPRGAPYSPKTVAIRIGYIQEYCRYLADCGVQDENGYAERRTGRKRIDESPLAHLASKGSPAKSNVKPKVGRSDAIRPVGPTDLRILMDWAVTSSAPGRNGLIFQFGWVCGLRKDEALGLKCAQFRGLTTTPQGSNIPYNIAIFGKGRKTRNVPVPGWLIDEVNAYIEDERANALAKGRRQRDPAAYLFVGATGSKTPGKPVTASAIDAIMQRACMESGLVEQVTYRNPETRESQMISRPRYSYHDLRHTYACLTYHLEKREGNAEPWKKIQANLGHSHMQTTIDTYLNWVELFSSPNHGGPDYRDLV